MQRIRSKFRDRRDAGDRLARELEQFRGRADTIVLGLPRGGVILAARVSADLDLPLDVLVVRKLGVPGFEELAMGAIGPGGIRVENDEALREMSIGSIELERATVTERREQLRREQLYRGSRPPLDARGKTVIVVDDGLATGSTMRAAVAALRALEAAKIVVAVPVAATSSLDRVRAEADEAVCIISSEAFQAVGYWYDDFAQTTDDEVIEALASRSSRTE